MHKNPDPLFSPAPAKLNLFLHVLGRNGRGYHKMESLIAFTQFGDRLTAQASPAISLKVEGPFAGECGSVESNLVLRAAHALAAYARPGAGAELILLKNIPVAGGLGGGSSNAAAVIRMLKQLWGLSIKDETLADIALGLGADVPVCLQARPAVVRGMGQHLGAAPALPDCYVLLVNPRIALPTGLVFENLRERYGAAAPVLPRTISSAKKLAHLLTGRRNDLQLPATELVPEIQDVLAAIAGQQGCLLARMSGSGATCFGLFARPDEMGLAAAAIARAYPAYWQAQTRLAG